jgi:molybdenum cofactor synthesis domain-containing protein
LSRKPTAEIISIGNELLIGHTLDTNSHWIAKHLTRLGWTLERVTQLRDSLDSIKSGVRGSLKRNPSVLITIGGLGPTHDDMTLAGISRALNKPLRLNKEALQLVKDHYRRLESKPKLTKYRTKMATLPQGSAPLPNPVGTAPGVKLQQSSTIMFSLPGVPSEMKAIFRASIIPYLESFHAIRPKEIELKITGIIESALAPVLDQARKIYPKLYFKSHPRGRETGIRPLIHLHIYNIEPGAEERISDATAYVMVQLARIGGRSKLIARKQSSVRRESTL